MLVVKIAGKRKEKATRNQTSQKQFHFVKWKWVVVVKDEKYEVGRIAMKYLIHNNI